VNHRSSPVISSERSKVSRHMRPNGFPRSAVGPLKPAKIVFAMAINNKYFDINPLLGAG
jgi:hypothetical protein